MGSLLSRFVALLQGFEPLKLPAVETEVWFYKPIPLHEHEKPYQCEFNVDAVQDARKSNIEYDKRHILVRDIRGHENQFTLERNGFEIMSHESVLRGDDFKSNQKIESVYLPECSRIVMKRYNASEVYILGFSLRDNSPGNASNFKDALRPVKVVHIDQSRNALKRRVAHHLGMKKGDEIFRTKRCLIVNIWRPISDQIEDYPLSYCDTASMTESACVAVDLVKRGNYSGEALYVKYEPHQRFYFISKQRPCEITLMKMAENNPCQKEAMNPGKCPKT